MCLLTPGFLLHVSSILIILIICSIYYIFTLCIYILQYFDLLSYLHQFFYFIFPFTFYFM